MDPLTPIRAEYERYRRLAERAIDQIDDEQLRWRLRPDGNSIAITMAHLAGNLRSRFTDFLTTDGEKPWRRRDDEFEDPPGGRAELLEAWQQAWHVLEQALAEVAAQAPAVYERQVTIRGQALGVLAALQRSVTHAAYHCGQIVLLARTLAGPRWRSLSIPRGQSAAFAADPNMRPPG
jgi:uncharacterized damage-inducible protein DinB